MHGRPAEFKLPSLTLAWSLDLRFEVSAGPFATGAINRGGGSGRASPLPSLECALPIRVLPAGNGPHRPPPFAAPPRRAIEFDAVGTGDDDGY